MIRRKKQRGNIDEWNRLRKFRDHANKEPLVANFSNSYVLDDNFLGQSIIKSIMSEDKMLLSLIAFRCVNSFLIHTYYVPDEYWQSLEISHNIAYGYGHVTWEWRKGIRGYLYPAIFAILYKVLELFSLDYRSVLIGLPRLMHSIIAAYGDLYLYRLSRKLTSTAVAQWVLLCQLTSWFTMYISTRTLTNCTESTLTLVALYLYPWPEQKSRESWRYILVAAISVVIRPTAAIIWVLMGAWHLQRHWSRFFRLILQYGLIGLAVLSVSASVDRLFYGRWMISQLNFLSFNVFSGIGSFYGTHPWHWYVTQGFPAILFPHIYPFLRGALQSKNKVLLLVIMWTIAFYSFLGHKEFRFIYPILPLSMFYCGEYFQSLVPTETPASHHVSPTTSNVSTGQANADITDSQPVERSDRASRVKCKIIFSAMTLVNVALALYFCLIHQRGSISVMNYLAKQTVQHPNMDVLFLMPCHSTPYYSYLHVNVTMRFLTCEPNFDLKADYLDEADKFYQDPATWLETFFASRHSSLPSHIVHFDSLTQTDAELSRRGYRKCAHFFHSHMPQGRTGRNVIVRCL